MITKMNNGTSNNDIPKQSNNGNTRNVLGTFFIQTYALTKKNLTLQRRNLTATLTVYFSGFLLLLLIWIASVPLDEMTKVGLPEVTDNKHPQEHDIQLFVCSNPPKGTDCCK